MITRQHRTFQTLLFLSLSLFVLTIFTPEPVVANTNSEIPHPSDKSVQRRGVPKYPDVSATQIVFLFDGELWLLPREGGTAAPLTKESGPKSSPKFSPDGQTIAFTGSYDGIYTIPVKGGAVTRVTHNPGATDLCDWTPDGRLLFMTDTFFAPGDFGDQAYLRELYTVPATGGLPSKLPVVYGANGAISRDGNWLAYTPYAEGRREHKMHYQGGLAPDIWLFSLSSRRSKKITDWAGTDTSPMWHGETIYYLSDGGRERRRNIWSYELRSGRHRQITDFKDFDIKWPSIGPGSKGQGEIVFIKATDLYLLDLSTEVARRVNVTFPEDRIDSRPRSVDASKFIANWNLSPDGKQAVVEARGRLWTVPSENGLPPRPLTNDTAAAERYPAWSPDGRWIAYFSDVSGEYQLYVAPSDGRSSVPRQSTYLGAGFRFWPSWSPDSRNIAFSDSSGSIYVYNLETGKTKKIHQDPVVRQPRLNWSPDSSWLAFTGSANSLPMIWLYDVERGEAHQVTGGGYNDKWPTFDRRGDYLFFVSDRNYDALTFDSVDYSNFIYPSTELLMAVPLRRGLPPPWQPRNKSTGMQSDNTPRLLIDFDDIERRAIVVASDAGNYSNLAITQDGQLLYTFVPTGAGPSVRILGFTDLAAGGRRESRTLLSGAGDFRLSGAGKKLLVRKGNSITGIDPSSGQELSDPIRLADMSIEIDSQVEWKQIFAEAWRLYRDFFYDPAMRGVDWPAVRQKYAKLLDVCANREDVDYVIGEMLGELGSSHVYLNPPGGNEPSPEAIGMLGVDFSVDHDAYRINKIYDAAPSDTTARNPLREPGVDIHEGDYLLAVNGKRVAINQDPWAAFEGLAGKRVMLTVSSRPVLDGDARNMPVQPGYSEAWYRHRAWIEATRSYVERKSGGRIGYVYLKMTSEYGFREFTRQFGPQDGKQALIIDARWNQGGHIPFHLIDVLRRQLNFYSVDLRRNVSQRNPSYFQDGPKCILINGVTQSGGDLLAYLAKRSAVATLVGTRTMGAMAGAGGLNISFDGGYSLVPTVGFYDVNGKWIVEGRGVQPDIAVADDPASMINGSDPQLEAAIKLLINELRSRPSMPQAQPPFRGARVVLGKNRAAHKREP